MNNEDQDVGVKGLVEDSFDEETAAEFTANEIPVNNYANVSDKSEDTDTGSVMGFLGIIMAVMSFFWMPWLFGFGAVLFGIISAMRRNTALGVTAIVIGSASLIMQMFYYFGYWI